MTNSGFIALGVVTFGIIINASGNNGKCDKLTFFKDKMKSSTLIEKRHILFLIWRGCWCLGRRCGGVGDGNRVVGGGGGGAELAIRLKDAKATQIVSIILLKTK